MADANKQNVLQKMYQMFANTPEGSKYLGAVSKGTAATSGLGDDAIAGIRQRLTETPLKGKIPIAEGVEGTMSPFKTTAGLIGTNIKAHPWKTAGLGLGAATNIAGLVDNDKLLGQLIGTGLGTGAGMLLKPMTGFGLPGIVGSAMAGGALGSLFDNLRAKKEQEEQYQQQYV